MTKTPYEKLVEDRMKDRKFRWLYRIERIRTLISEWWWKMKARNRTEGKDVEFSSGMKKCTKTYYVDNIPAFIEGKYYSWRWATDDELEDGYLEYCLESELTPHHYLGNEEMIDYF